MANLAAVRSALRYGLLGLGVALLTTAQLQGLLAERLQRDRIAQQGPEVLFQLRLAELALDRLPPAQLARAHGGQLERLGGDAAGGGRFGIALQGCSQPWTDLVTHSDDLSRTSLARPPHSSGVPDHP